MKTTLDLPDDVLIQAKVYAAQHQTTLKELVTEGLRRVTATPPPDAEAARRTRAQRLLEALDRCELQGPVGRLNRDEIYDRHKNL